ncbi:hypothetical protein AB1K83_11765 [Sporosarcina sp. 179-K 3D1 HS]|uniref:hypothetical protein n=1 Tax=Sporosarcina sp. 179-K 3D1 HS TaxID=3232169 RepID=UPI0039A29530
MIQSATLYTDRLKSLRRFYGFVLGLDVTETADEQFTVRVGTSHLTFKQSELPAYYHFAINIPGNQFSMMKYWITERVTLNRDSGRDEVYFSGFDADSMYFEDPAGNIVELIGRRKRDLFGDLTKESFLNISEIGIVTPFVTDAGERLMDEGIPLRKGTEVDPNGLNFLGREDWYLVLVPPGRTWYFSQSRAATFPLELTWGDAQRISVDPEGRLQVEKIEN